MKTLSYNALAILLTLFLLVSCKDAKKSIEETLHPKPQKKTVPAGDPTSATVTSSSFSTSSSTSRHESYPNGQQNYKSIFESAAALDSIQQALLNMPGLKGKKLFFMAGFYFYDFQGGIISIQLQDPNKPENVDTYTYRNGEWQIEKPVKITGNFPLKLLLMPLDELKFSTAKKVYDTAVEKSKTIEGAEPITHVYFSQLKQVNVEEWYVMINGARHNYRLKFDINGKLMVMN